MNDTPSKTPPVTTPVAGDRLAKVMARAGLCSRRDAEEWIRAGRVTVNGRKVMTPAFNVSPTDDISVDGAPLADKQGTRVWLYHKPRGLVVTEKDPEGRPTVFESVEEKGLPRVVSIGRLDINTEGLLLLTNDGGLKRVLELPATGWLRKYRVRAHGTVTQQQLDRLKQGMEVDGVKYGPIDATLERDQGANVWLELSLREGKNREVKNVLLALGLEVNRLIRISYGPFQLGDLPVGAIETVKARVLKEQLGKRLAEEAEVDFESELPDATRPRRTIGVTEERTHGRGTHTTTIAAQRFRFTDRAEMTPAEAAERRAARPRVDRPGGRDSGTRRDARPSRFAAAEDTRPARHIHFDDGREPTVFEEKTYGKKPRPGAKGDDAGAGRPARSGARPARADGAPGRTFKPREDRGAGDGKPARKFDGKPRSDRPMGKRPPRADGDSRPPRSGAGRPARSFDGPRPEGAEGRPARSFSGKPRSAGDGDKRPARGASDRPFSSKPRAPRADSAGRPARAFGDKPAREGRSPRPAGAGDRPARTSRPDGAAPRSPRPAGAGRPSGGRPSGGRPSGGKGGAPRKPSRPRDA